MKTYNEHSEIEKNKICKQMKCRYCLKKIRKGQERVIMSDKGLPLIMCNIIPLGSCQIAKTVKEKTK